MDIRKLRKLLTAHYLLFAIIGLLLLTALFLLSWSALPREPKEPNVTTVLIREGLTVAQVSELLNKAGVLSGEYLPSDLEGYLFPDTYEFYVPTSASSVVKRFSENFNKKVMPAVAASLAESRRDAIAGKSNISNILNVPLDLDRIITVASIIEREVPDSKDRRIVSGIIWKRLNTGFPLQVDAVFCYVMPAPCKVTPENITQDSPYNTYTRKGLPPTPISSPGLDAILASVGPEISPYWFYLSEPETDKTIFSVDLDEHRRNIVKYLR